MEIQLYGCRVYDTECPHQPALALMFRAWSNAHIRQDPKQGVTVEIHPEDNWTVIVPDDAEVHSDENGFQHLHCLIGGVRLELTPNTVNALADLKLHGFRFKERGSEGQVA